MSLESVLPAPRAVYQVFHGDRKPQPAAADPRGRAPPYGQRKGFVPRSQADFGDGGSFPEIHVAQYPLGMGRVGQQRSSVLPVSLDAQGQVRTDALVKRSGKTVHSQFTDLVERDVSQDALARPDETVVAETTERTRQALEKLVGAKVSAARPVVVPQTGQANGGAQSQYVRYTPNQQGGAHNSGAKQRIVRLVEAPVDPLEPPKFKHKKVPQGPPSPPPPVMHSPPRKLTVKDQQDWKIPPCVSNWKNAKGYTIPLDKRVAADGRGLQEVALNDSFAKLSESLYIAERQARDEVEMRAAIQKRLMRKEQEQKEEDLRELAARARMERAGIAPDVAAATARAGRDVRGPEDAPAPSAAVGGAAASPSPDAAPRAPAGRRRAHSVSVSSASSSSGSDSSSSSDSDSGSSSSSDSSDSEAGRGRSRARDVAGGRPREAPEERRARQEREQLRRERRRELEREMRLAAKGRRTKTQREAERDVSERVALGMPTGRVTREPDFDARLFNQSQGVTSGFGEEEEYNVYSKPLFASTSESIYRPRAPAGSAFGTADEQYADIVRAERFQSGEDAQEAGRSKPAQPRAEPVQFERAHKDDAMRQSGQGEAPGADDPLGLGQFLTESRRGRDALDRIGRAGGMAAGAGGSSREMLAEGAGRSRVDFRATTDADLQPMVQGGLRSMRPRSRSRSPAGRGDRDAREQRPRSPARRDERRRSDDRRSRSRERGRRGRSRSRSRSRDRHHRR